MSIDSGLFSVAAIGIPFVGSLLVVLVPERKQVASLVALVVTALTAVVGLLMLAGFDRNGARQFEVDVAWIPTINSRFHLFVDGISLPLLLLSMAMFLGVSIYSLTHDPQPKRTRAFASLMLLLQVGVNGTFLAQDLVLFFLFFELVLVPMYFLIGVWGGSRRQYAALKFFVFTVLGSAVMLVGFLAIYFFGGNTFSIPELSAGGSAALGVSTAVEVVIFGALLFGFAVKIPMFPVHTWMPDAHTEAPTAASVILASVMLKLGGYGLIRIALPILPEAAIVYAPIMGFLGVLAIIYGALGCLAQTDLKRLIAFSSLSHMGFVVLGIATCTTVGIAAAVFAMIGHGLITGLLFFVCGGVQHRLHTREISKLGGLLNVAPRLSWVLGFAAVASLGIPGLAGFWGEFGAILAAFAPADGLPVTVFRVYMVTAAIGTVLAAAYLLWMFSRVAFGKVGEALQGVEVRDLTKTESVVFVPLMLAIVVLGVAPALILDMVNPSVAEIVNDTFGRT